MTKEAFRKLAREACKDLDAVGRVGFMERAMGEESTRPGFSWSQVCYDYGRARATEWLAQLDAAATDLLFKEDFHAD